MATRGSLRSMPDVDALDVAVREAHGPDVPAPLLRIADAEDAGLVHALYVATPSYFEAISIPVPTSSEVRTDLLTAVRDERRTVALALGERVGRLPLGVPIDPRTQRPVLAYLDYKLDYPETGDATVNLLLVHGSLQSRGYGAAIVNELERRLAGRAVRVLASIYGRNPRARRFWERLGYRFAIDARPVLDWYAKRLA
jgi:GNAT superfamily N-acetyltransferase